MAAGSVTVAALRHRPRQALLVVGLAAVVTAAATLGPLYARAVEQSVLRTVVADAAPARSTVAVTDAADPPAAPARLAATVRSEVPPELAAPIGGAEAPVVLRLPAGGTALSRLTSRDGVCTHLLVAAGRCPRAPGEVLVSRRTAAGAGLSVGSTMTVLGGATGSGAAHTTTVVGLYQGADLSAPYWAGRAQPPTAARPTADEQVVRTVDDVFTPWATLATTRWPDLHTHVDLPLVADRLDVSRLAEVRGATASIDAAARTLGASASSDIPALLDAVAPQRHQARTVIPLLAVQLAVLGIVVLSFVCAAATEQRRPEIALARLRGHGTRGAAAMLLRELGLLVAAGTVLGAALGWLVTLAATHLWLRPGVPVLVGWPVALAALAALAAGLLAILAAGAPTLRQPLTSLLRRVPPRASTLQVGLVEGAVVAAAAAGVVTLLTGDGGPVALLAPGLLAIAGGLLLAQLAIPTAGPLARVALRRGRLPWALAALQIARRPALRRLIAIVTVACALLVFAVDAWNVADRNRATRAQVEAGAPVVLTVDADSSVALRRAVLAIDPHGRFATPVVTVSSATPTGPRTTAVEPAAFARIARWGDADGRPSVRVLRRLSAGRVAPVVLTGDRVEVSATVAVRTVPVTVGGPDQPLNGPLRLRVGLRDGSGVLHAVDLGRMRTGPATYRAAVDCRAGCHLDQVGVDRTFGDFVDATLTLNVDSLRAGTAGSLAPVDLDTSRDGAWQPAPYAVDAFDDTAVTAGPRLTFVGSSFGTPVTVQRGDRPVNPPALAAGPLRPLAAVPGRSAQPVVAPDLGAGQLGYDVLGRLPLVPRSGDLGVLVDLAGVQDGPSTAPAQTTYAVWLASVDPARERAVRRALVARGLQVLARDTAGAHAAGFAREGPSLALRLSLLAGLVAVVLAAAVLVVGVATSGVSRARDLAGLRIVGVPASTVRASTVREHLVVAVLGVLAGAALGLVAAQAALPDIPLFATRSGRLPLVLTPAWPEVAATVAGCLLLLGAVSVVVGRALAAAAVPARLREGR